MASRPRDLIVVGASAGGVEALRDFVAGLPADLPAAVLIVLHLPPGGTSALPAILTRAGLLPVMSARHGDRLQSGQIYVAPPDHHLLVVDTQIHLSRGPTENGYRPAIDALFRSAAQARGPRVLGVVLSGALDDGTAGLAAIKSRGGLALVQDPDEALYRSMPDSAIAGVQVDHLVSAKEMGHVLARRLAESVDETQAARLSPVEEVEARIALAAEPEDLGSTEVIEVSEPSGLGCPDCRGTLFALDANGTRYRCRVGHAWTAQALLQQQSAEVEQALWAALRALQEKRDLAGRMARDAEERGYSHVVRRYTRAREEATHAADVLRTFLLSGLAPPDDSSSAVAEEQSG